MTTPAEKIASDTVAWSHSVARAEGGVLERVADAVARAFTLRGLAPLSVRAEVRAAVRAAAEDLKSQLAQVYDATRRVTARVVDAATPPQVVVREASVKTRGVVAYTPAQARDAVERLTKKGSWASGVAKITRAAEARAAEVLAASVGRGLTPGQIEVALEGAIGSARDWRGFVRTELQRVNNQAAEDSFQANRDLLRGKQYLATLDTRTCPVCGADDGVVFSDDPGEGERPLSEAPEVPRHDNCRCTYAPVVKSAADLERDAGIVVPPESAAYLDGQAADRMSYGQWLAGVDDETQRAALGPARMELYKSGVPIQRFVDDGRALSAEELQAGAEEAARVLGREEDAVGPVDAEVERFVDAAGRRGAEEVAAPEATPGRTVSVRRTRPATLKKDAATIEVYGDPETIERLKGRVRGANRRVEKK